MSDWPSACSEDNTTCDGRGDEMLGGAEHFQGSAPARASTDGGGQATFSSTEAGHSSPGAASSTQQPVALRSDSEGSQRDGTGDIGCFV